MTTYSVRKYTFRYGMDTSALNIAVFLHDDSDVIRGIFMFTDHMPTVTLEKATVNGLQVTRAWLTASRFTDFYTMIREEKPLNLRDEFVDGHGSFNLVTGESEPVGEEEGH